MIKSDSFARATQAFCRVGMAFVLLVLPSTVSFAADSCKADVVFLMDNTGSMGGMISSTRTNAVNILNKIGGGDARFAGIDVQFGVATFWGDPREFSGGSSWYDGYSWCGPTPSFPTRGTPGPVSDWTVAYRCDNNAPDDASDDRGRGCWVWYGVDACEKPGSLVDKMLSAMTPAELTSHYSALKQHGRKAYRVDQGGSAERNGCVERKRWG